MHHAELFKLTFIQIIHAYTDRETKGKHKKRWIIQDESIGNKCDLETKTLFREEWRKATGQARVHQDLCERSREELQQEHEPYSQLSDRSRSINSQGYILCFSCLHEVL